MTEALLPIVQKINGYLSDYILVALLIAVGLWYSIKTRFVQVRHFKEGWNSVFGSLSLRGGKQESGMSSFQALATAIAAQVGTGNIVGASGAILTGGPGAIFWMWVIAFLGMATIYAEATLAQETRTVDKDGNVLGGPVYYITTAFKGGFGKFLAGFFAVAIILALGFFGCMVQSNSIGETFSNAFNVPTWIIGVVLVAICGFIFLGGVQRLASVTEKIVPIMAAVFLAGGLIVLIARIKYIPATFGMIFRYAFAPQAIIGGGFGAALKIALSQGAKRGLFSNEAGMGSTPHAHAQANVKNPHQQGVVALIGVFLDTFVVKRSLLLDMLDWYAANNHLDLIEAALTHGAPLTINTFMYDGYCAAIFNKLSYFRANMDMLDPELYAALFPSGRHVKTKTHDTPPAKNETGSKVTKSLVSAGCRIYGIVDGSVLSRNVIVEPGAVVTDSILMQGTVIKSGAVVDHAIIDRNNVIPAGTVLKGTAEDVLAKGKARD